MSIFSKPKPLVSVTNPKPAERETGWYWVRPDFGAEKWVPAKYIADARAWYSVEWGGQGDRCMVEIGEAIVRA